MCTLVMMVRRESLHFILLSLLKLNVQSQCWLCWGAEVWPVAPFSDLPIRATQPISAWPPALRQPQPHNNSIVMYEYTLHNTNMCISISHLHTDLYIHLFIYTLYICIYIYLIHMYLYIQPSWVVFLGGGGGLFTIGSTFIDELSPEIRKTIHTLSVTRSLSPGSCVAPPAEGVQLLLGALLPTSFPSLCSLT